MTIINFFPLLVWMVASWFVPIRTKAELKDFERVYTTGAVVWLLAGIGFSLLDV